MKISFFGDISLFNIDHRNFSFDDKFRKITEACDYNVGNLECPITKGEDREAHQVMYMSAAPESLRLLKDFDVFSLANNHIRDFGTAGLEDTIRAVEAGGFQHFGAGKNKEEALKPLILKHNDLSVALIGATRYANATPQNGGGTAPDTYPTLKKAIRRAKAQGHFVVLYLHWGYEYVRIPSPRERKLAHRCIDAGADLIIGAHPHIYQGIETYKSKKIIYSLGNFIFHSSVYNKLSPLNEKGPLRESFAAAVVINPNLSYSLEIHGYRMSDSEVAFYDKSENDLLDKHIEQISDMLRGSRLNYLKKYYRQAYQISEQNIKVRNNFQLSKESGFLEKLRLYRKANTQDIKNRIAHLFIKLLKPKA